jgi:hypothetical protein
MRYFIFVFMVFFATLVALLSHAHADDDRPPQAITDILRPAVVHMVRATGFYVRYNGHRYLMTNWHVCFFGHPDAARTPIMDPKSDLCVIPQVSDYGAALKMASDVTEGQTIFSRGFPAGSLTESKGVVQDAFKWTYEFPGTDLSERDCPYERIYRRDTYISCRAEYHSIFTTLFGLPGSSGSPVVDEHGDLVGVVSSAIVARPRATGMVRLKDIKAFLEGL